MEVCTKSELMLDFNSRIRLSLPFHERQTSSLKRVREDCEALIHKYAIEKSEASVASVQRLGAIVGETLKAQQNRQRQQLFLAHSLAGAPEDPIEGLGSLRRDIAETSSHLTAMQEILRSEAARDLPYLALLAEYVGHLYVQYLGELSSGLTQFIQNSDRLDQTKYSAGWRDLRDLLQRLTTEAAGTVSDGKQEWWRDEQKRELHLVRIGQLKKFFHANLFVEVAKKKVMTKFKEPAAATAAAFAAIWAAYFQHLNQPKLAGVGLSGLSIISLGVAAYVLKDRMKEGAKNFLARKASQYLPDLEQDLSTGERSIGRVREWLNKIRLGELPREILALRNAHRVSAAESHLQEDVLHHARHYAVKAEAVGAASGWAVQESLRINLERYLKHLDDPYKDLTVLAHGGQVERMRAHRVYHFFLIVKTQRTPALTPAGFWKVKKTPPPGWLQAFRIVMDKSGIQRVESFGRVPAIATQPVPAPSLSLWGENVPSLQMS